MKLKDQTVRTYPLATLDGKKRIILYPAASGSDYLISFFRERHPELLKNIIALGDKDPNKTGLRQNGLRIYPPSRLASLQPDAVLVTSPALFTAMERDLRGLLGESIPVLLADEMEEYLRYESGFSALAQKAEALAPDLEQDGPEDANWYLCMPFGGGRFARSKKAALTYRMLEQIRLPKDLTGKSVLDLACSDGFYSFECEARGAAEVVAVEGPGWENPAGFDRFKFLRSLYRSNIGHAVARIEDYIDATDRTFDLVLSLGIYYHLPDPLAYFKKLAALTRETLIVTGRTIAMSAFDPINTIYDQLHEGDACVCTGRSASVMLLSDRCVGKWTANVQCLMDMLRIAGFSDVEVLYDHCPAGSFVSSTAIAAHK